MTKVEIHTFGSMNQSMFYIWCNVGVLLNVTIRNVLVFSSRTIHLGLKKFNLTLFSISVLTDPKFDLSNFESLPKIQESS